MGHLSDNFIVLVSKASFYYAFKLKYFTEEKIDVET